MFIKSVSSRVKLFNASVQSDNKLGRSLMILLETHQLEASVSTSILKLKNSKLRKYMASTLLTLLLESLHGLGFYLDLDHWLPITTTGTIMDRVLSFNFNNTSIIAFHKVRLAYQFLYPSDAFTLSGKMLLPLQDCNLLRRKSSLYWLTRVVTPKEIDGFISIMKSVFPSSLCTGIRSSKSVITWSHGKTSDNKPVQTGRILLQENMNYELDIITNQVGHKVIDAKRQGNT